MNEKSTFGFRDGILIFFQAIAVNLVIQLLIGVAASAITTSTNFDVLSIKWISILFSGIIELSYIAVVLFNLRKRQVFEFHIKKKLSVLTLVVAALLSAAVLVSFFLSASLGAYLLDLFKYRSPGGVSFDSPAAIVLGLIVMCVLAPIGEELVFRGALLSSLKQKFNALPAAFLCAFAFALMHMNPEQTLYQFALGFALSAVTLSCGSVLPAIIMHGISNLIAVLLSVVPLLNEGFAFVEGWLFARPAVFVAIAAGMFLIGSALIVFACRFIQKKENTLGVIFDFKNKQSKRDALVGLDKGAYTIFWVTIGICLIVWISMLLMGLLPVGGF